MGGCCHAKVRVVNSAQGAGVEANEGGMQGRGRGKNLSQFAADRQCIKEIKI
uniref:Uncharacterized protein n=1 Tax=Hyaloperonospora arabidopsidis (strain Emoy2) TaxID=559515 RepID=M4BPR8_HYAAE